MSGRMSDRAQSFPEKKALNLSPVLTVSPPDSPVRKKRVKAVTFTDLI